MSRRYVFTLNNPTQAEKDALEARAAEAKYMVIGQEVGANQTPHLQGFVIFNSAYRFARAKEFISVRAHIEVAKGTSQQAAQYCKKDGSFTEYGELPVSQGKRNDWDKYIEWVKELGRAPTKRELCTQQPSLYARYPKACSEIASYVNPHPALELGEPRDGWQRDLNNVLHGDPSPRDIVFIYDPEGNSGKSWFCRYWLTKQPDESQVLRIGKRDDLAHAIDPNMKYFLFDIPRTQMEFLQYSVLEGLKDRMVFSPKYASNLKVLTNIPHVVVFCNEHPDMTKLTGDRYNIIQV